MRQKLVLSSMPLLILILAFAPAAVASSKWYVNGANGSDSNNCQTLQAACLTIAGAISRTTSGDSIVIAAGTYGENLSVNSNLSLNGAGARATIIDGGSHNADGGGGRVLVISNTAHVAVSNLTIQNGIANSGGGVLNSGTLTINNCSVLGNSAGNESVAGGGGILNYGTLTINNSTLSGNTVSARNAYGGAIYNSGSLTINTSTLNGNSATGILGTWGGGVGNYGKASINSSTFSGNSSTTGGNIYNGGTAATIQNSILANSTTAGNCSGTMTSKGYNLSSDKTCQFTGPGDRNSTNPKLGVLQNNGGPTQTMALLSGSPAIDKGNSAGCTDGTGHLLKKDQRGAPRPDKEDSSGCDVGAYERQQD